MYVFSDKWETSSVEHLEGEILWHIWKLKKY